MKTKTNYLKTLLIAAFALVITSQLAAQTVFQNTQTIGPYSYSIDSDFGDINGDGFVDAYVVNIDYTNYPANSQILINDGTGLFAESDHDVGNNARAVTIGDFDDDGYGDVFIGFTTQNPEIYLGSSSGALTLHQTISGSYPDARKIENCDIDGDDDLDVIVATGSTRVEIWINDGSANFSPGSTITLSTTCYDVKMGDINGDGTPDLAISDHGYGQFYLNDGSGNFTYHSSLPFNQRYYALELGDLDGDGDLDAAYLSYSTVYSFKNDGNGNFSNQSSPLSIGGYGVDCSLGDLDSDGDLDLVVASSVYWQYSYYGYASIYPQADKVYLNNGTGSFGFNQDLLSRISSTCPLADIDNDNDLDLLTTHYIIGPLGLGNRYYQYAPHYVYTNQSDPGKVKFYNSQDELQAGGVLEYREGGGNPWQTANEVETGVFEVDSDAGSVALRMNNGPQIEFRSNIPTPVTFQKFQTKEVTVGLKDKDGVYGHDGAVVDYTSNDWHSFGTTGDDGTGLVKQEMLPLVYTFRMDYEGGRQLQQQVDIATTQTIDFQTTEVTVELLKSDNTLGHDGGVVKYNAMGWTDFGTTGDDGTGFVTKELLPDVYSFKVEYEGGKSIERNVDVSSQQLVSFNTIETTVELRKSDNTLGLDGGDVLFGRSVPSNTFGATGSDGLGLVKKDLLPGTWNFSMNYDGVDYLSGGHDITIDPVIVFNEDDFKSGELNGNTFSIATYPNPFSNNVNIGISNDKNQHASVVVYNMSGQQVAVLHDGMLTEGIHKFSWDSNGQQSGMYIVRFTSADKTENKQVVKL